MTIKIRESDLDEIEAIIGYDEFRRLGLDTYRPGGDVEVVSDDDEDAVGLVEALAHFGFSSSGDRLGESEPDEGKCDMDEPEEPERERPGFGRSAHGDPDAPRPL